VSGGSCEWFPLRPAQGAAWVEAHRDRLPQTLDELARLPMPFRRAIVNTVPPAVRTALWREHLASFVGPGSALTPEQQAFVRETIVELPVIFDGPDGVGHERARRLEARMAELLTRQQAARIFATLGPPEPPGGLPLPPDAAP